MVLGWIGLDVEQTHFTATVTGYAFDDSGGDILAGQTPEPSGLALLALGAAGIAALRRRGRQAAENDV